MKLLKFDGINGINGITELPKFKNGKAKELIHPHERTKSPRQPNPTVFSLIP
jgi:hypothetical protein